MNLSVLFRTQTRVLEKDKKEKKLPCKFKVQEVAMKYIAMIYWYSTVLD
jgi:hypothetical protein